MRQNLTTLADAVRAAMKARGLSLRQTAELSGVPKTNIGQLLGGGIRSMDLETMTKLCRWLGEPVLSFMIVEEVEA